MSGGSNFSRKYTISKHTGPIYINSYALKGIGVQYRNPTGGFDPVSMPTGWVLPRLQDTFRIDLSQEHVVLEQAAARRQAIVGEAPDPNCSLRATNAAPLTMGNVPLIPYQSSTILTPVPVSGDSGSSDVNLETAFATISKPLGEMSLKDFEGDSSDPFEFTALQAIDDLSELQSVLQPELNSNLQQTPPTSVQAPPTSIQSHPQAPPQISSSFHPSNHTPHSHSSNNLSTTPPYLMNPPVYSSSVVGSGGTTNSQRNNFRPPAGGVGVLVDFTRHNQSNPIDTPPATVSTVGQNSTHPPMMSSSGPRPPPVSPKPRARFSEPQVVPMVTNPSSTQARVSYPNISVMTGNQEPRPPPYTETEELYTTTPISPHFIPHVPPTPQFKLPDIQNSLRTEEREAVMSLSGMGFPPPRVARAFKHFKGDNQTVLDFLFLVGELEEKGYNGDSAEAALLNHNKDVAKSVEYLDQVKQYNEMWPEESIHTAYSSSGQDWEKTLDILSR